MNSFQLSGQFLSFASRNSCPTARSSLLNLHFHSNCLSCMQLHGNESMRILAIRLHNVKCQPVHCNWFRNKIRFAFYKSLHFYRICSFLLSLEHENSLESKMRDRINIYRVAALLKVQRDRIQLKFKWGTKFQSFKLIQQLSNRTAFLIRFPCWRNWC